MIRTLIERLMLRTGAYAVDTIIKDAAVQIERLKRTQEALHARAERYEALADTYDNRAVMDRTHASRALHVIAKLEDIFG